MRTMLSALIIGPLLAACGASDAPGPAAPVADAGAANPLLQPWDTTFGVPPFDAIESSHYLPALRAAIAEHAVEIDRIAAAEAPPTFDNTIVALERSGALLSRVVRVFYAVSSANTDDTIRETGSTIAPELSAHRDDISLNQALFARVDAVYRQREALGLSPESLRLLEETHLDFVRAGVNLPADERARLREVNARLASLSESFEQNLLAETNDFELLVTDRADLGPLPASLVAAAANEAKRRGHECECWVFTLQRPSINPFLEYSPNRELRRRIYTAYAMRGDNDNANDNKAIIAETIALRDERAALLGYDDHAAFVLADRMAGSSERVYGLMDQVWPAALQKAREERDALQAMMAEDGVDGALQGWDWRHYTERLRKEKYAIDAETLRPYFEFTAVRDGAFATANRLFGLTFERRTDLPTWHPDQQVFEVFDRDGSHLAVLYMDFFARASKRGGAWMNALRPQSNIDGYVTPIVTNNFNFPPPGDGTPSLLSFGEAQTLFHEFGHALHGMLSDVTYPSLSGTATPRDFVEFPSQVMENWISEPQVLRLFARHYRTGETISDDIIGRLKAAETFNQGFATVEFMAAAYLDLAWHTRDDPDVADVRAFEDARMAQIGLIDEIIPRYRSTYFAHIFSGGYSAGYYSYLWSEVLDADAFDAFIENGLFDADTASAFRRHILSRGGTRPGMELYRDFRGRDPEIGPLLQRRGLTAD